MTSQTALVSWPWRIAVSAGAYVVGAVLGGALVTALSIEMPEVPGGADPSLHLLLLIPGGVVFSLGLAAMAVGLAGRLWERWLILTLFLWGINGVGNAIETTIFTTLGGPAGAALAFLLPAALCALAVTRLFPGPSETSFAEQARAFFSSWRPWSLALRIVLAILAFPIIYFVFGAAVAPIVVPYYEQLDFLKVPAMSTLLPVLHLRSALILLVTLPVVVGWDGTRARAIVGLGLGNAAAVGLGGLAQVTFFPPTLRWVHGAEILVDGFVYGLVLALLFIPKSGSTEEAPGPAGR